MTTTPTPPAPPEPRTSLETFVERVRTTNPFLANRVDRPLSSGLVDVPAIHEESFQKIISLARQAHQEDRGIGAVVWGEAGIGKSHLLSRLWRWAGENRQACFVYLHNLQASPDRLPRYVLKCVVSVLTGGQVSFLYKSTLFLMVNAAVKEALREDGLTRPNWDDLEAAYQRRVDRLAAAEPSGGVLFNRTVYDVLLRFFRSAYPSPKGNNPEVARLALRWLSGDWLDSAEARRLGLPPGSSQTEPVALPDNQHVKQVLVALTHFARTWERLFLLCFDQVDNLDEDQVRALSRFLHDLLDSAGNLLVVTTGIRQTLLAFLREGVITETSWQRLGQFEMSLGRIRQPEGWEILRKRLDLFLSPFLELPEVRDRMREDSLFPLGTSWLDDRLGDVPDFRPRDIISWAGDRWQRLQEKAASLTARQWLEEWQDKEKAPALPPLSPAQLEAAIDQTVDEKLAQLKNQRLREPQALPPSEDNLSGLLYALLQQMIRADPLSSIRDVRRPQSPKNNRWLPYDLVVRRRSRDDREIRIGIRILTPGSANTTAASLRWLLEDPQPPDQVLLVTDGRQELPMGAKGRTYLETLNKRGEAAFKRVELTFDQYADLDALLAVSRMARSGDLNLDLPGGQLRPLTEEEVIQSHQRRQRFAKHSLLQVFHAGEVAAPSPVGSV